jgi:hypothetical protein
MRAVIKGIWRRLGSEHLFSFQSWLIMTIVAVLPVALFNAFEARTSPMMWAVMMLASQLCIGATLLLYSRLIVSRLSPTIRAAVSLGLIGIVSLLTGRLIAVVGGDLALRPVPTSFFGPRSGDVFAYVFVFLAICILVDEGRSFRLSTHQLKDQLECERELELSMASRLEHSRERSLAEVETVLRAAFARQATARVGEKLSVSLHELVSTVIQPLAHSLTTRSDLTEERGTAVPPSLRDRGWSSLWSAIKTAPLTTPFSPVLGAALIVIASFNRKVVSTSLGVAVTISAVECVIVWLSILAARTLYLRLASTASLRVRHLLVYALFLAVGVIDAGISFVVAGDKAEYLRFLPIMVLADFIVLFMLSAAISFFARRQQIVIALELAVLRTSWLNSRLAQSLWLESRRFGLLIHGEVQSRITIAALKLDLTPTPLSPALQERFVDNLRSECLAALTSTTQSLELREYFESLTAIWHSTTQLERNIPDHLFISLEQDPAAVDALKAIISEAVGNAVKHAKPPRISISLERERLLQEQSDTGDLITVVMRHDSPGPHATVVSSPPPRVGLGSLLFDELSYDWALERGNEQTVFTARVPVESAPERDRVSSRVQDAARPQLTDTTTAV